MISGNVKLSDFGVSLNLNAVRNFTAKKTNDVNGTPNWMAPEVIKMQGASKASDIWSLGCTLIELVDSKPPYSDLNTMAAMYRIVSDDDVPIPLRCSPELTDFLKLCFAKDPLLRPSAVTLFDHAWLKNNWNPYQDLRAQDSIPFLRRISTSREIQSSIYS
jgi:serine/threonine protein kinase